MSRKVAREELFKLLFEADLNNVRPSENLENVLGEGKRKFESLEEELQELDLTNSEKAFIKDFVEGIDKNLEVIDRELSEKMDQWSLETIGNVERALLRFGVYELMFENTGYEIVLNEIIELAKIYGDSSSHEFVNGVLAKFVKK
jgi:N utilization substance protein B